MASKRACLDCRTVVLPTTFDFEVVSARGGVPNIGLSCGVAAAVQLLASSRRIIDVLLSASVRAPRTGRATKLCSAAVDDFVPFDEDEAQVAAACDVQQLLLARRNGTVPVTLVLNALQSLAELVDLQWYQNEQLPVGEVVAQMMAALIGGILSGAELEKLAFVRQKIYMYVYCFYYCRN